VTKSPSSSENNTSAARAVFLLGVALVVLSGIAAATPPPVTVVSPCECQDAHGKGRWTVKNDPSTPPTGANAIQAVTPSDMFYWPGIDVQLTWQSERTGIENNWYALTGCVVAVKVEADGDLDLALQDATGDKPGMVVAEIPAKPQWCELRQIVFGWTRAQFLFRVRSGRKLKIAQPPTITVIGKAFFDIGHSPADQSNRPLMFLRCCREELWLRSGTSDGSCRIGGQKFLGRGLFLSAAPSPFRSLLCSGHQPVGSPLLTHMFRRNAILRMKRSNQSMKPMAPWRSNPSVLATTPCRGLSLSR
jgi:hypothetical protein